MTQQVIQLPYTSAQIQSLLARVNSLDTEFETRLNELYPVGSIYIGTGNQCPIAVLGVGTWQLKAQDKVLQGAGTRGAVGTILDESLPNIKGSTGNFRRYGTIENSGALYRLTDSSENRRILGSSNETYIYSGIGIDASRYSSTYQDNAPVQQDAYLVNIWERTA